VAEARDIGPIAAVCWREGRPFALQRAASVDPSRLRWDNFYNWLDPVSGRLKHFDALASVHNHAVSGASVPAIAHRVRAEPAISSPRSAPALVGEARRPKDVSLDAEKIVNARAGFLARASPRLSARGAPRVRRRRAWR